jgi:hypothetical protein
MNYKKQPVAKAPPAMYRPTEAVRRYGDSWSLHCVAGGVSVSTSIALRDTTKDAAEAVHMSMMERGVLSRTEYLP